MITSKKPSIGAMMLNCYALFDLSILTKCRDHWKPDLVECHANYIFQITSFHIYLLILTDYSLGAGVVICPPTICDPYVFNQNRQKQPPESFCEKGVYKNFAKFPGKHLCQSLFFNKVIGLRPATLACFVFLKYPF